jgi:hypothetical protein
MLFIAETQMNDGLTIWAEGSAAAVQSILVGGPLFGALTAWQTGSILRSSSKEQLTLSHDQGSRAWVQIFLGELFWAAGSYLGVVIIVHAQLLGRANWGGPTWVWLVGSFFALAFHVACGLLAGFISSGFLTPLLTAVLLYVFDGALLLTNSNPLTYLSPGYSQVQEVAFGINQAMLAFQGLWYVGATLVVLSLASFFVRRLILGNLSALAVGLTLSCFGVIGISMHPGFFIFTHSGWTPQCEGSPTICVHPAVSLQEPEITAALLPTVRHIDGTAFGGTKYVWSNRGLLAEPQGGEITWHLDALTAGWQQDMRQELATDLLTPGSGSGGPCDTIASSSQFAYSSLGSIVLNWLSNESDMYLGVAPQDKNAAKRFASLTELQKRAWLNRHESQICTGSISAADF